MASSVEQQRQMAMERRRIQREEIIEGVDTTTPPFSGSHDDLTDVTAEQHQDLVSLSAEADAVLALAGQELDLDVQAANSVFKGPDAGAPAKPTFAALVAADIPALGEGPGIDIVGRTVGLGLDTVLLSHGDGTPAVEYATITLALAAASSGDTIYLPPGTFTEDITIPDGVIVRGSEMNSSIIAGQVTFAGDGWLSDAAVVISANDAATYAGVWAPDVLNKVGFIDHLFIMVVQAGAGSGYGIAQWGRDGSIEGDYCPYIFGTTQDVWF